MNVTNSLESAVKSYSAELYRDGEAKNKDLALDGDYESIAPKVITTEARRIWARAHTIFERFSVAKHALQLSLRLNCLSPVHDLISPWLMSCVEAGAYSDCIRYANGCIASEEWARTIAPSSKFSVLRSRAKSLRNIGHLEQAQECYRELLSMAHDLNARAEISTGLLLIGKLYGNYWGQLSLFSSFVEEAKARVEHELKRFVGADSEFTQLVRCLAICHDALGQAYRNTEHAKVEKHFEKAIKLNRKLGRWSGLSRTLCHLSHFKFKRCEPEKRTVHLQSFREGMNILLNQHPDERGLGIRSVQYSSMLLTMNDTRLAEKYLMVGKHFARRYSEYKTLTRAALFESDLHRSDDPERALRSLREGLIIAKEYRLQIHESEINLQMAEISNEAFTNSSSAVQVTDLFRRNREIYFGLINVVKGSLSKLDAADALPPEFELLSLTTRRAFREKLLLDFDHTVNQLDLNIDALVTALSVNERKRQEQVIVEVLNSMARLLLHEYKNVILADTALTPLEDISVEIKTLAERLDTIKGSLRADLADTQAIDTIVTALKTRADQIHLLGKELGSLKRLLSERLKRPRDLKDRVSLSQVVERAVMELKQMNPALQNLIVLERQCDIRVLFNNDILIVVIQNLIRNAIEGLGNDYSADNRITVTLGFEPIGDMNYNNDSAGATLSIIATVDKNETAANIALAIQAGLEGNSSEKEFGSGVGLDTAKKVFPLMGASIEVTQEEQNVGIKITFKTDPMNARLVFADS
ncbi:MAG TPA: hypothetical protein VGO56_11775 [Pyrinomonadaceae bacterium]|jgi:tetratricopeptide (TPR) repeat protein|nr:hypothetical protein [Pyrinomonadaceae bacterium]